MGGQDVGTGCFDRKRRVIAMPIPTYYTTDVLQLTPEWLQQRGKSALLLDLDNTLLPRDTQQFSADVLAWVQQMKDACIKICLVSNNWHHRAQSAADELECALVAKAIKPLPPAFLMALRRLGVLRRDAVVVGDQFFTDCLGAALLGMTGVMVLPLAEHDLPHTLFLRNLERFVMGDRRPQPLGPPGWRLYSQR